MAEARPIVVPVVLSVADGNALAGKIGELLYKRTLVPPGSGSEWCTETTTQILNLLELTVDTGLDHDLRRASTLDGWKAVRLAEDVEIDDRRELRDRVEFVRDDQGDWYAFVQWNGSGRGYIVGSETYAIPTGLGQFLDLAHDRYEKT